MSKSQFYTVSYEHDFDENELYDKIRVLSMKNNRCSYPPRIFVYKNNGETIALLDYSKKVTLCNSKKFNFKCDGTEVIGKLESITASTFETILIQRNLSLENKLYENSVMAKCSICRKDKMKDKFMPTNSTQSISDKPYAPVLRDPWSPTMKPLREPRFPGDLVAKRPLVSDKGPPVQGVKVETLICISCHKKKSANDPEIETSMELMEELDPTYRFRTMYDNYIMHSIYSKKHGLTKDAYINKIENDLLELNKKYTECILMIHKLTKIFPSNELPIAPIIKQIDPVQKHIYILNLGCANRLINTYSVFKTNPPLISGSEKHYILKFGVTFDIKMKYNKYEKLIHFTYDTPDDNMSILAEKSFKETFADVCFLSLREFISSKIIHHYRIFITGENKVKKSLIVVNEKGLNMIKTCIEYL